MGQQQTFDSRNMKHQEKKSTAASAASRKAKSRANQTAKKSAQEKKAAQERMASMRAKTKVQNDCLCLRKFLTQDILDDVDRRVADLEYGIISSKWDSSKWTKIWHDPNFECIISGEVSKYLALATTNRCVASGDSGNSGHGCEENGQEYSLRLVGNDLFLSFEEEMKDDVTSFKKDDVASFKRICPKMYLHKFELKVAQFECSLLIHRKKAWDPFVTPALFDDDLSSAKQDVGKDVINFNPSEFVW